jgi:glycosyltransferase involved in cell wall biosynthesis
VQTQTTTIDARDIVTRADTCSSRRVRALTVSRIDPRKGLRVLPQVVRLLADRGFDMTLDVVGPTVGAPGKAEQRAMQESARALGVADRITLLGAVPLDRLLPLYREYDVFVLPTGPGEGVPRVLLEAMAAGVPVVTTAMDGIASLVRHEQNGLLVDEPTAVQVAAAMARVLGDGVLRRRLIAGGYVTVRTNTLQALAARMMHDVSARLGLQLKRTAPVPVQN